MRSLSFLLCRPVKSALVAASAALFLPQTGQSQESLPEPQRRTVLSVNPLAIPLEIVQAEIETRISPIFSLSLSASYFGPEDFSYSSFDLRLKGYPNEEGPKGFALGASIGVTNVKEEVFTTVGGSEERTETLPGVGVFIDYNWLMGKTKRFVVGSGFGMKRLFGGDDDTFSDASFTYPTARLQVGWRF